MQKDKFYGWLYDGSVHDKPVSLGKFVQSPAVTTGQVLPRKSPDNPHQGIVSGPLMQGILVYALSRVQEMGFETADGEVLYVRWTPPEDDATSKKEVVFGRLNLKTRILETNNLAWAGATAGLLGMLAAFHYGIPSFKEAWSKFTAEVEEKKIKAFSVENIGCLADIAYGALRYGRVWPSNGGGQDLDIVEIKKDPNPTLVQDLKKLFSNAEEFDNVMVLTEAPDEPNATRFQGEELGELIRFVERRKHVALLGPPGVGKSLAAFEAMSLTGHARKGVDYQLFTCHEEVKTSDLIGGYQPDGMGGFVWVDGPLVRAMIGNGGKGMPILVEEFTRMPTKSQNVFISALSDGYIIRNEKPDESGVGEIVLAGPEFMVVADMNVDASCDDIDLYGAAFASRVRKIEFSYPRNDMLTRIVKLETKCGIAVATAVGKIYDFAMKLYNSSEVGSPLSPRSAVYWVQDYNDLVAHGAGHREAAQRAARGVWLRDVCGVDQGMRDKFLNEIEGAFRQIDLKAAESAATATPVATPAAKN